MNSPVDKPREVSVDDVTYPVIVFYPQYISPPLNKAWQMKSSIGDHYGDQMAHSNRYELLDSAGILYRLSKKREFGMRGWFFRLLGLGYLAPVLTQRKSLDLPAFREKLKSACRSRSISDGGNPELSRAIERIELAPSYRDAILCVPEIF